MTVPPFPADRLQVVCSTEDAMVIVNALSQAGAGLAYELDGDKVTFLEQTAAVIRSRRSLADMLGGKEKLLLRSAKLRAVFLDWLNSLPKEVRDG